MKHGRESLNYDLMDPLRSKVDRGVIEFIRSTTFSKEDFLTSMQGVCKLNPQRTPRVVSMSLADVQVQGVVTRFRDGILRSCPKRWWSTVGYVRCRIPTVQR